MARALERTRLGGALPCGDFRTCEPPTWSEGATLERRTGPPPLPTGLAARRPSGDGGRTGARQKSPVPWCAPRHEHSHSRPRARQQAGRADLEPVHALDDVDRAEPFEQAPRDLGERRARELPQASLLDPCWRGAAPDAEPSTVVSTSGRRPLATLLAPHHGDAPVARDDFKIEHDRLSWICFDCGVFASSSRLYTYYVHIGQDERTRRTRSGMIYAVKVSSHAHEKARF